MAGSAIIDGSRADLVYSLLSILVTQISTILGNVLNIRAQRLKDLTELLTDPVIRTRILTHPLIGLVENKLPPGERLTAQKAEEVAASKPTHVSWIEPTTFVDVLVDVLTGDKSSKLYSALNKAVEVMTSSVEKSQIRELIRKVQLSGFGLQELRDAIKLLADAQQRQTLLDALNLVEDALDALQAESSDLIPLLLGVRQIQDPYLQRALDAVLTTASPLKDAQQKLSQWFDTSMARATEMFKREMQRVSIVVLLMALILNVDTIHLAARCGKTPHCARPWLPLPRPPPPN
jgi:hypothetical protein